MAKKCKSCNVPLEGFFAKIASLAGVKPSAKNADYCNKCESKMDAESAPASENEAAAPTMETPQETVAEPEATQPEVKEEPVTEAPAEDMFEKTDPEPDVAESEEKKEL